MKEYISLLCPTRRRPNNVDRLIESALSNAHEPEAIEFVFYVDDDDEETLTANAFKANSPNIRVLRGPRITLSQMWNECYEVARGPIYQQTGDDLVYRTPNWDFEFRNAFHAWRDRIGLVFADDGSPNGKTFATHGLLHRNWVRAVGHFTPSQFSSDYGDTWINDVAGLVGRKQRARKVFNEHMHPVWKKAPWDDTHNERLVRHNNDDVEALYKALDSERQADALKLIRFIENPPTELLWSILIPTIPQRHDQLKLLLALLQPQVDKFDGQIEVLVLQDDQTMSVGEKRQKLMEAANGRYISFVDDDDLVADNYCEAIMEALSDNPDYVGFQLQLYVDATRMKPTFHSLKYVEWSEDKNGYYRNISHLNPILRGIAMKGRFDGGYGEDHRWAQQIAETELLKAETYVDEIMYHYRSISDNPVWKNIDKKPLVAIDLPSTNFREI